MAKKSAKKSAKRGAKKAARRSRKGGARPKPLSGKMQDLQELINDPDTCERVTAEKIGPGEWRIVVDPTR
jgi:hypothetical protein